MGVFKDKVAGWWHRGSDGAAEGSLWSYDATNGYFRIRTLLTAIAHAMTSAGHTAGNWTLFYSNGSGGVTELSLGAAATYLRSAGTAAAPTMAAVTDADLSTTDVTTNNVTTAKHGFAPKASGSNSNYLRGDATWANVNITPTLGTRAVVVDTAYQPSTTQDALVYVSVQIATGAGGDGKIEAMVDVNNPPTTVQQTFRVGTADLTIGGELVFLVKAGNYYKLTTTSTAGAPTFTVVGSAYEVRF